MRQLTIAAVALLAAIAGSWQIAINSNYGPLGPGLAWALHASVGGMIAMAVAGLAFGRMTRPLLMGLHFAWLAPAAGLVVYLTAWKGSWDLMVIAAVAGLLGLIANLVAVGLRRLV